MKKIVRILAILVVITFLISTYFSVVGKNNKIELNSQANENWCMFQNDACNTGSTTNDGPDELNLIWEYQTDVSTDSYSSIHSSPTIYNGLVFVAAQRNLPTSGGYLYCLNAFDGSLQWMKEFDREIYSSIAIDENNEHIYFGSKDRYLYCYNVDGDFLWRYGTDYEITCSPAIDIDSGRVFINSGTRSDDSGIVYCLNSDGTLHWKYVVGHGLSGLAVSGESVYTSAFFVVDANQRGKVFRINKETGEKYWETPEIPEQPLTPTFNQGAGVLYFNTKNGIAAWHCDNYSIWLKGFDAIRCSPALADGDGDGDMEIYLSTLEGVYCLNAANGYIEWTPSWTNEDNGMYTAPAVADGKVYVGSYYGKFFCLDAATGNILDTYETTDPTNQFFYSAPAVWNNKIYVGGRNGIVYCLGENKPDLDCDANFNWQDIPPGATMYDFIAVSNIGAPGSNLNWEIQAAPDLDGDGDTDEWTFDPDSGTNLKPSDGPFSVTVKLLIPNQQNAAFSGKITVVNQDDPSDYESIPVTLTTPRSKTIKIPFLKFIEKYPIIYKLFQQFFNF